MTPAEENKDKIDICYTIGRTNRNDIQIENKVISGTHARITFLSAGTFILEDIDSTNGTFLNDRKIIRALGSRADAIRFANIPFDLNKHLPEEQISKLLLVKLGVNPEQAQAAAKQAAEKNNNAGLKKDINEVQAKFQAMKQVYKEFTDKRKKLEQGGQLQAQIVRAIPGNIVMGLGHIAALGSGPVGIAISLLMNVGANIAGILAAKNATNKEKIEALDKQFRIDYICPNCERSLEKKPWDELAAMKVCPACKVQWIK